MSLPLKHALAGLVAVLAVGATLVLLGLGTGGRTLANLEAAVPSPSRVEERTLASAALGRSMPYAVYLPPGYDSNTYARYPVVYMLHGLGGSHEEWQNLGLFTEADALIASGQIEPMIIVTPEGERGYWVDHAGGGPRFGTYVARDLVAAVDHDYRTQPDRASRAIGGMSMGGQGALQLALNNTGEFSIVGAHSLVLRRYEEALPYYGTREYFEANDPVSICAKDEARAERLRISIDIGTGDQWYGATERFHQQLKAEGIAHTWQAQSGGHDAAYWSSHVDEYLRYYSAAFQQEAASSLAQH